MEVEVSFRVGGGGIPEGGWKVEVSLMVELEVSVMVAGRWRYPSCWEVEVSLMVGGGGIPDGLIEVEVSLMVAGRWRYP